MIIDKQKRYFSLYKSFVLPVIIDEQNEKSIFLSTKKNKRKSG